MRFALELAARDGARRRRTRRSSCARWGSPSGCTTSPASSPAASSSAWPSPGRWRRTRAHPRRRAHRQPGLPHRQARAPACSRSVNDEGKTVVLVTHNPPLAQVADRVLQLRDGQHRRRATSTNIRSTRRTSCGDAGVRMLLLKTWRDMNARKGQFGALVVLVALGIDLTWRSYPRYYDLKASADRAAEELRFATSRRRCRSAPSAVLRRIAQIPGVAAVEGRLVLDTGLDLGNGEQATARVVGVPLERPAQVNALVLLSGRMPRVGSRDEVLVNSKFANEVGIGVPATTSRCEIGGSGQGRPRRAASRRARSTCIPSVPRARSPRPASSRSCSPSSPWSSAGSGSRGGQRHRGHRDGRRRPGRA